LQVAAEAAAASLTLVLVVVEQVDTELTLEHLVVVQVQKLA
jgi:hypothetical protein